MALGADYVDIEWRAHFDDLLEVSGGQRVVLSMHEFDGVPRDMGDRTQAMRATGAEVVKVAVMARRLSDNLALLPLAKAGVPTVLVAMGAAGVPSRVLAARVGSCWTYAGDRAAPGQLPATELCGVYGFRRIGARTAIYGVVGQPIDHSLSPVMHNAAFRHARIDAVYLPLAAEDLDDFFSFAEVFGVRAASVTAPFKVAAFERADESDPVSRRIRSVNTLRRDGRRWIACNTDVAAFLGPLQRTMDVHGARVTVMGAGGAARAVALALGSAGARVSISARHRSRADEVAGLAGATVAAWPVEPGSWDVLVNATPVGTFPELDDTPLTGDAFGGRVVYDLVYNPPTTRLLREAAAAGCHTISGLDMLVAQAQRQFEWWTGMRPSERVMRDAALRYLQQTGQLNAGAADDADVSRGRR
jgi:3-dehydroquinate dehydratase/shikimate dehydrogenase